MTFLKHSTSALDWEVSIVQMQERSERRAWQVAKVASVIAVACAVAFVSMLPFYRLIPLPIEVDRLTGDAEVIDVLDARHIKLTELVDRHWLTTYVQTRERYFWPFLQMDYDAVRAMSDSRAERDYEQIYAGPDALDKSLGPDIERRIKILSTGLPPGEPGRAVVRFMRTTVDHGQVGRPECFLATIAYQYKPRLLEREREGTLNPLGFKVTAYSRDADYGVCQDSTASRVTSGAASVTAVPASSTEAQR